MTKLVANDSGVASEPREMARGEAYLGTCGMGIGETKADSLVDPTLVLTAADLRDNTVLRRKLRRIRTYKLDQLSPLQAALAEYAHPDMVRAELAVFQD